MKDKIPERALGSKVYLMGICGTGMAALAGLLKEKGFFVTGSDSAFYPPMDQVLKDLKIPVYQGYDVANLEHAAPDLVIIRNVIRASNPEAAYVIRENIPYMSFPQALGRFFLRERKCLVVAGTHGKTTTSAMLVSALKGCGFDPGFLIGGVVQDAGRGFEKGTPPWFVIEGDEYDTAFFNKVSKFLHYMPKNAIITSLEFDHADIFPNFEAIKESFEKFVSLLPGDGTLVVCADWPSVIDVADNADCRVVTYALKNEADWIARDIRHLPDKTSFLAVCRNGPEIPVSIQAPGNHNVLNSLSVLALCHSLGLDTQGVVRGLERCKGVKRRQEIRGEVNGVLVIDDFAHHPRAVSETLMALKARFGSRRLVAVFEPRTNTSRRAVFQEEYASAFQAADKIMVRSVPDPEKAPEGDRFSSRRLADDLRTQGKDAGFYADASSIIQNVLGDVRQGDVYVILSNGPFENIHERLLDALRKKLEP